MLEQKRFGKSEAIPAAVWRDFSKPFMPKRLMQIGRFNFRISVELSVSPRAARHVDGPGGATDSSPGQGCPRQPPPGVDSPNRFLTCERSEASNASILPLYDRPSASHQSFQGNPKVCWLKTSAFFITQIIRNTGVAARLRYLHTPKYLFTWTANVQPSALCCS